jgi:uncharacterized protein (UPF0333 family)
MYQSAVLYFIAQSETVNSTATGDLDHEQLLLGLLALVGTSIAALVYTIKNNTLGKTIKDEASAANNAVNNVGPGEHRLYDLVAKIEDRQKTSYDHFSRAIARVESKQNDFDKKWGNLPPTLDNAVSLSDTITHINERMVNVDRKLDAHIDDAKVVLGQMRDAIQNVAPGNDIDEMEEE